MGSMCISSQGHTLKSKLFFPLSTCVMQVLSWEKPSLYLAITNIVDPANKISGFLHNIIFILNFTDLPFQGKKEKLPRWWQTTEIPWAFVWYFNNESLDRHFLTFGCIKSKGGIWNFSLVRPSVKQCDIYWGHFLRISSNSGHSKKGWHRGKM